jgi:hypothetical protein
MRQNLNNDSTAFSWIVFAMIWSVKITASIRMIFRPNVVKAPASIGRWCF